MKNLILFILVIFVSGCSNQILITQGETGNAGDLDQKYEIVETETVQGISKSNFGFGGNSEENGAINLPGYNDNVPNILKGLTFLIYSAIIPTVAFEDMGIISVPIGLAVGGILNMPPILLQALILQ